MASATATRFTRPLDPRGLPLEAAPRLLARAVEVLFAFTWLATGIINIALARKRGCLGGRGRRGMHRRAACRKQHLFVREKSG